MCVCLTAPACAPRRDQPFYCLQTDLMLLRGRLSCSPRISAVALPSKKRILAAQQQQQQGAAGAAEGPSGSGQPGQDGAAVQRVEAGLRDPHTFVDPLSWHVLEVRRVQAKLARDCWQLACHVGWRAPAVSRPLQSFVSSVEATAARM